MPLKESKGNMYDWVTHTWNPIKGRCSHNCSYCYVKRWGELKPLRLDEKEFNTDLGKGNFIFVGSGCDIFASDIPKDWIIETLNYCKKYDNTYLFQTKNPMKLWHYEEYLPNNSKICVTLESNRYYKEMKNSPHPNDRLIALTGYKWNKDIYLTIEPILDFDNDLFIFHILEINPKQVNIGADSGKNDLHEPEKEKVLKLISELEKFTTVKLKKNLNRIIK